MLVKHLGDVDRQSNHVRADIPHPLFHQMNQIGEFYIYRWVVLCIHNNLNFLLPKHRTKIFQYFGNFIIKKKLIIVSNHNIKFDQM